jgi:hypothetical protein
MYFSADTSVLQVHSDLLDLCGAGIDGAWTTPRFLVGVQAHFAV